MASEPLERHPSIDAARRAYADWLGSLPPASRGTSGDGAWRRRCVAAAMQALMQHTGRETISTVLELVGFGSRSDIARDRDALRQQIHAQGAARLDLASLIAEPGVRDQMQSALETLLHSVQDAARSRAARELEEQRAEVNARCAAVEEHARQQVAAAVARADEARAQAVEAVQAAEAVRREAAAKDGARREELGALRSELENAQGEAAEARAREAKARADHEAEQRRVQDLEARWLDQVEQQQQEVVRLEGATRRATLEIDAARQEAVSWRTEAARLRDELKLLDERWRRAAGDCGHLQQQLAHVTGERDGLQLLVNRLTTKRRDRSNGGSIAVQSAVGA